MSSRTLSSTLFKDAYSCHRLRHTASKSMRSLRMSLVVADTHRRHTGDRTYAATAVKTSSGQSAETATLRPVSKAKSETQSSLKLAQNNSDTSEENTKTALRALLREVAQPVAVVTSFMPKNNATITPAQAQALHSKRSRLPLHSHHPPEHHHLFHGATLSSLSSVAMDPYPLVAFALRVPSRMAATLSSLVPTTLTPSGQSPRPSSKHNIPPASSLHSEVDRTRETHLVLNILSKSQQSIAHTFSRPDLHPHPFTEASHTLNADGLPVLKYSLGALACRVVGRLKLEDLEDHEEAADATNVVGRRHKAKGVVSELFIARVVRVEAVGVNALEQNRAVEGTEAASNPLLYWRRGYTTCQNS